MIIKLKNVNYSKLHKELLDAGIEVIDFSNDAYDNQVAENATLKLKDNTVMSLAHSIIDSHDPTPRKNVSNEEVLKAKIESETINLLIELGVI